MNQLEAVRLATKLTEQVLEGLITKEHAEGRLKKVIRDYKKAERLKDMQKRYAKAWVQASKLVE